MVLWHRTASFLQLNEKKSFADKLIRKNCWFSSEWFLNKPRTTHAHKEDLIWRITGSHMLGKFLISPQVCMDGKHILCAIYLVLSIRWMMQGFETKIMAKVVRWVWMHELDWQVCICFAYSKLWRQCWMYTWRMRRQRCLHEMNDITFLLCQWFWIFNCIAYQLPIFKTGIVNDFFRWLIRYDHIPCII